jgi:arylsulfatase A-like enzyme
MRRATIVNRRTFLRVSTSALALSAGAAFRMPGRTFRSAGAADPPNIVIIYADDLGYGDVSCYGATRIRTPNIDRLASQGLQFDNAHAPAATCTPSRYAMLTGEYAWRRKGTGILPGNASMIIQPGRTTLPSILKEAGYATGVVGKWHLGLGEGNLDWNQEIKPGPLEIGFDYCFLIPATGDRVPCVYMENRRVVGLDPADPIQVSYDKPVGTDPTGKDHPELLKMHPSHGHDQTIVNGISRIGYMSGGKAARWIDEDIADVITGKAVSFIEQHSGRPFFLYFSTHDIHVPRVPHPRFAGKSGLGPRGDAILEFDSCAGEILKTLDRLNLTQNTLVILTSDNGPVVDDGYRDEAVEKLGGHTPSGPLRGGKYSAFDAGTRIPFLVKWPGRVKPGHSDALVCQVDFLSSLAALAGPKPAVEDAPDSYNILSALLGESRTGRDHLVEQAGTLSLIQGSWKYIEPSSGARFNKYTNTELGNDPQPQLYNLAEDIGEKQNLAARYPDKVKELAARLEELRRRGRSRPSASTR